MASRSEAALNPIFLFLNLFEMSLGGQESVTDQSIAWIEHAYGGLITKGCQHTGTAR